MKRNIMILAITFSVALNIVFIGSYFYHKSGLVFLQPRVSDRNSFLYEELSLSRGQLDKLEPFRDRFHTFVDEQGRKIKDRQLELVGLLSEVRPDRRAIDAKQEEIQVLQQEMQARVIHHLLEESRIFTPEQRQKFFALLRGRMEKSNAPRPRWMQPKRGSSLQEK